MLLGPDHRFKVCGPCGSSGHAVTIGQTLRVSGRATAYESEASERAAGELGQRKSANRPVLSEGGSVIPG